MARYLEGTMSKQTRIFYLGGMAVRAHSVNRARRAFIEKGFARCVVYSLMREMKTGAQLVNNLSYFMEDMPR